MVFVVHRSSSPSTFCSPPVHRLSTLARLPACLPGGLSVLWRMGLYRANVQTWIIPPPLSPSGPVVPPHPLGPPIHHRRVRRSFSHFSFLLLLPVHSNVRRQKCTTGRANRETPAHRLKKATLAMSIFNEHFSLRRPVRPLPREAGRQRRITIASTHHPPCPSEPPFLSSESVQKSLTATAALAAHKIPSASRRSSPPAWRPPSAARDNRRRRNLFHRKVVYHN